MSILPEERWVNMEEASAITSISIRTIQKYCLKRMLHPRCARKVGGAWRFNRQVLLKENLVFMGNK